MGNERKEMRQLFLDAWEKRQNPILLSPLEQQILSVIKAHKEYESIFDDPNILDKDYRTDNNPFLHMSLHLGIIEQLTTNRPKGLRELYQKSYRQLHDEHEVQHAFMEVMAEVMFDAQKKGALPDELIYLEQLQKKCNKSGPLT